MRESLCVFFFAMLCSYFSNAGVLTEVEIVDLEVRFVSGGYVLARLDKEFNTCAEGRYLKLKMDGSALSNAAYSTLLSAKVSGKKVDLLSSNTCEHFNVLERVKLK